MGIEGIGIRRAAIDPAAWLRDWKIARREYRKLLRRLMRRARRSAE